MSICGLKLKVFLGNRPPGSDSSLKAVAEDHFLERSWSLTETPHLDCIFLKGEADSHPSRFTLSPKPSKRAGGS